MTYPALRYTDAELAKWLDSLHLERGNHDSPDSGMCAMEAIAWVAGDNFNDQPECVSPVIRAFAINWNDSLNGDDRDRFIKPLMLDMIGTNTDSRDVESELSWMAIDWLARTYAPAWLRLAQLTKQADQLTSLQPLNPETAASGLPTLRAVGSNVLAARDAARVAARDAARVAAGDAARVAAGDAARVAARDAAGDAARVAAGDAAGDAAWVAAGDAAGAAAWVAAWDAAWVAARVAAGDAARVAAGDAAGDAARAAAWAAAWDAAWDAAGDVLRAVVEELQPQAADLLERMCAHAKAAA